ncbi:MAG: hypothetical protein ABI220_05310 [Candidatus Saccharimonadales bacterium]
MSSNRTIMFNLEDAGVLDKLQAMEVDDSLNTESTYCANSELYPDNQMPFADRHIAYLKAHPKLDPQHYLANLRLMIRVR